MYTTAKFGVELLDRGRYQMGSQNTTAIIAVGRTRPKLAAGTPRSSRLDSVDRLRLWRSTDATIEHKRFGLNPERKVAVMVSFGEPFLFLKKRWRTIAFVTKKAVRQSGQL